MIRRWALGLLLGAGSVACIDSGTEVALPDGSYPVAFLTIMTDQGIVVPPIRGPFASRGDSASAVPGLSAVSIAAGGQVLFFGFDGSALDALPPTFDRTRMGELRIEPDGAIPECPDGTQRKDLMSIPFDRAHLGSGAPDVYELTAESGRFSPIDLDEVDDISTWVIKAPSIPDPCPAENIGRVELFTGSDHPLSSLIDPLIGENEGSSDYFGEILRLESVDSDRVIAITTVFLVVLRRGAAEPRPSEVLEARAFDYTAFEGLTIVPDPAGGHRVFAATNASYQGYVFEAHLDENGFGSPIKRAGPLDREVRDISTYDGWIVVVGDQGMVLTSSTGVRFSEQNVGARNDFVAIRQTQDRSKIILLEDEIALWTGTISDRGVPMLRQSSPDVSSESGAGLPLDLFADVISVGDEVWLPIDVFGQVVRGTGDHRWEVLDVPTSEAAKDCSLESTCGPPLLSDAFFAGSLTLDRSGDPALLLMTNRCSAIIGLALKNLCPFTLELPGVAPGLRSDAQEKLHGVGPLSAFSRLEGPLLIGAELGAVYELTR